MKQRQTELDILRFLALLCVASLHVNSSVWSSMALWSADWLAATLMRTTWAVPVFVMISGRFFLDPEWEISPRLLFKKYIPRILIALLFWGVVYQLYYLAVDWPEADWKRFAAGIVTGAYHMWFLWMLLGLYAVTPLLRKIAEDQKLSAYFLLLHVISQCLDYYVRALPLVGNTAAVVLEKLQLRFVAGYSGYYLLGYCLHRWQPTKRQEWTLYAAGAVSALLSLAGNLLITAKTGENSEFFTNYQSPSMMVQAGALYLFFLKRLSKVDWKIRTRKLFSATAKYGFGAYLAHALVNEFVVAFVGRENLAAHPLVLMPVCAVVVTAISFALAAALRKLPRLGKFIA